ncbi:MAG: hypothetical protein FK733_03880 [Asgard group archaeon]|nr:hypothetical protein [Asgard group archaeon]
MKKGGIIATIIVIIVIASGTFLVGYLYGNNFQFGTKPKQITPIIDGIIDKREWIRSTHYNLPFYLDVDNSVDPLEGLSNVDGWNYIHVAEDENYYYVALDLCSDRTNNLEDEWISFFLANRMPEIQGSTLALHSLVNYGFEYLFYNVSDDTAFTDYQDVGFGFNDFYDIPIVPETDLMYSLYGDTTSSYLDYWHAYDNKNFTIESILTDPVGSWIEGNYIDLQFGIDIDEKMPDIDTATFMSAIADLDVILEITANLTSDPTDHISVAEEFHCSILEHGPMPSDHSDPLFDADYNFVSFSDNNFALRTIDLDHSGINVTDGMYYFTIHCWNENNLTASAGYELYIDKMELHIRTDNYYTTLGSTLPPSNYDVEWSYGPSVNCAENHRQFEFRVAKSEFPNLALADDMLYLCVAGYGTMMLTGTNFWQYPSYPFYTNPIMNFLDTNQDFLALDMSST